MKARDLARMPLDESGKIIAEMVAAAPDEDEPLELWRTPENPTTAEFLSRMVHFPLETAREEEGWIVLRWANGAELHISVGVVCVWPDDSLN